MNIDLNSRQSLLKDVIQSKNYYYFCDRGGSSYNNTRHDPGDSLADVRENGSIHFTDKLPNGVPSAVVVEMTRKDCQRGYPELAITFRDGDTFAGVMCEVRQGTFDKIAQALNRNPALLADVFRVFHQSENPLEIPRGVVIIKHQASIVYNEDRKELEISRSK